MKNFSGELGHGAGKISGEFFKRKFPYPIQQGHYPPEEWAAFSKTFRLWKTITILLAVLLLLALPIPCGLLLYQIYLLAYQVFAPAGSQFFPIEWQAFCIPGLFAGLSLIIYVIEGIQKAFLGYRYAMFADRYNMEQEYDNGKAGRYMNTFFIVIFLLLLFPVFTGRVLLKADTVVLKSFMDVKAKTVSQAEIKAIVFNEYRYQNKKKEWEDYKLYKLALKDGEIINIGRYLGGSERAGPFIKSLQNTLQMPVDTSRVPMN